MIFPFVYQGVQYTIEPLNLPVESEERETEAAARLPVPDIVCTYK
jgi:hypothetical protein